MKKLSVFLFSLFFIFLCSCKAGGDDISNLSVSLSGITDAEYTAKVCAHFPDREAAFVINYSISKDTERASVLEPREVAGVSYTVTDGGARLEFDGALLEIGKLSDGGVSPFSCIGELFREWQRGDFREVVSSQMYGKEAYLVISTKEENELEYRTWFSKEDFLPLYAEIFSDGTRVIQCEFERSIHNR